MKPRVEFEGVVYKIVPEVSGCVGCAFNGEDDRCDLTKQGIHTAALLPTVGLRSCATEKVIFKRAKRQELSPEPKRQEPSTENLIEELSDAYNATYKPETERQVPIVNLEGRTYEVLTGGVGCKGCAFYGGGPCGLREYDTSSSTLLRQVGMVGCSEDDVIFKKVPDKQPLVFTIQLEFHPGTDPRSAKHAVDEIMGSGIEHLSRYTPESYQSLLCWYDVTP